MEVGEGNSRNRKEDEGGNDEDEEDEEYEEDEKDEEDEEDKEVRLFEMWQLWDGYQSIALTVEARVRAIIGHPLYNSETRKNASCDSLAFPLTLITI